MFIGHLALGFAAKRAVPRASLAMLFVAAQFADVLWPVLVALGIEQVRIDPGNTAFTPLDFVSYPYSHSLLLLIVWGTTLGLVRRALMRDGIRAAVVIGALVVSHWVLDFVTHRPDMPVYPGSAKFGLGLWNSIPATLAVEASMYVVAVWLYVRATRARDWIGRWVFWALVVFLLVGYVAAVGTVPPSVPALVLSALGGTVLLTFWSWWADAHRAVQSLRN
jgi:membrane-bound metal-dependent hydrolase YbcI (DUF457 family)